MGIVILSIIAQGSEHYAIKGGYKYDDKKFEDLQPLKMLRNTGGPRLKCNADIPVLIR